MPTEEYASVRALRENRLVEDVEMIFSRPSGEKIWLNVTALPLPKFDQIIIAYSDITKKKQQETLIKIHNEQLKELNATKDKFFSLIAHDLKSPFNSIIGFSELLTNHLNDYNPEKIIEFANLIRLSSRHAYELLKNLLEWARTQTGRIAYRPGKLYLKPLIEEVIESLQSNAFEKNIKVLPVITNNPIAEGDRYMIGSVLRNLISNAIKFTHKNGIIRIKTITLNDEIQVSIIDPGVGIKPEIIQKLFKISEQASTSGTNNEKGTGLGLIICKDFIDKHGGRIWVESQPGKGSVFHFTLPKI
jgi:signal transduction histidine kinase